jgi:hypothetical protein
LSKDFPHLCYFANGSLKTNTRCKKKMKRTQKAQRLELGHETQGVSLKLLLNCGLHLKQNANERKCEK